MTQAVDAPERLRGIHVRGEIAIPDWRTHAFLAGKEIIDAEGNQARRWYVLDWEDWGYLQTEHDLSPKTLYTDSEIQKWSEVLLARDRREP